MSEHKSFVDRCLAGETWDTEIDTFVSDWHAGGSETSLHKFLGMTWDEYRVWVEKPAVLRFILLAHKTGLSLEETLVGSDERLAIAARASSPEEAREVVDWLKSTGRLNGTP